MKESIYQTGTINSLLEAVYEGDISIGGLMQKGDFGLGALDNIDGELIICDGICYRADASGQLSKIPESCKTPFAVVNRFIPQIRLKVTQVNYTDLEQAILPYFPSNNLIYAIRITAKFEKISLRSEKCTQRPFKRLIDILPELQTTFEYSDISGVLVGVWFPSYLAQVNIPGFHFHFIDDERKVGGHVFGMDLIEGEVEIQIIHQLTIDMIQSQDFYEAKLDQENHKDVSKIEQVRTN